MIDQNLEVQCQDPQKQDFLDNIISLKSSQDSDLTPIDDPGVEVQMVQATAIKSSEEQLKYLRLQDELRLKRQLMKRRYENRYDINDFIRLILNIEILDRYSNVNSKMG